jgi:GT2 family glycosyltransferase
MYSHGIVGVTITHADRGHLCIEASESALRAGVDGIVIVMNGVGYRSEELLKGYAHGRPTVHLVQSENNTGSAGGFFMGLSKALELPADLFWLLDDDNLAQPDALTVLMDEFERRSGHVARLPPTLCSVRKSTNVHASILAGMPAYLVYPPPGSSLYFDVRHYIRRRRWTRRSDGEPCSALTEIPYAPFGGLLLHRATIEVIGLPQQALFLYEDDTDYTSRIELAGGKLYLARDSHIEDTDPKWTSSGGMWRGPGAQITAGNEVRLHYYVRNRAVHDLKMATTAWEKAMLCINSIVVLLYAALTAVCARKLRELKTFIIAMWKGYRGDLTDGPPLR